MTESNQTGTGLSDAERLKIRTEVQADAAALSAGPVTASPRKGRTTTGRAAPAVWGSTSAP